MSDKDFCLFLLYNANIGNRLDKRKNLLLLLAALAGLTGILLALKPGRLFDDPVCAVLESRDGQLLGARIAADGQWRFPASDTVPEKFAKAIVAFEDKRFRYHPGIDPLAIIRALRLNVAYHPRKTD